MGSQGYKKSVKMEKNQHLAFMYGTLKTGEPNHKQLFAKSPSGSALVGQARTLSKYPLIVTTPYNIPFLLHKEGSGHRIKGELYFINDETLKHIDWFEGHPNWYERRQIKVELLTDSDGNKLDQPNIVECWLYGLSRYKNSLLEMPQLEVYHDKEMEIHKRFQTYNPETDESLFHYLFD
uniref:Gamma-glutamylcyclotransferase family protein n=1 Tax=Arion vulgaris TaxID=1028688 RepID=A0A0B6ZB80_9EUPU